MINSVDSKKRGDSAYKDMIEVKSRFLDVRNIKDNEVNKFSSIKADFDNNLLLVKKNYKAKIDDLKSIIDNKEKHVATLNAEIEEEKNKFLRNMDDRIKKELQYKKNMEELSKFFSMKLSEIQKSLELQIEKISGKWETNVTEHLKNFDEFVKKFDIHNEN
jgi:hypothetical protein